AKCVLTGGACSTMGTDADGTPIHHVDGQAPSERTLLSWDEHKGIALQWNKLGSTEQEAFENGGSKTQGRNRLDWLRGERSQEQLREIPGDLRARDYVLGDIINSSPTFVGAPVPGTHPDGFYDQLHRGDAKVPENDAGAAAYSDFAAAHAERQNIVYVGANDGFVHGFRAGSYQDGEYDASTNDGREVLAYMPR